MGIPFAGSAGILLLEQVVSSEIGHCNLRHNQVERSYIIGKIWKANSRHFAVRSGSRSFSFCNKWHTSAKRGQYEFAFNPPSISGPRN
jgi:hypothetical protein